MIVRDRQWASGISEQRDLRPEKMKVLEVVIFLLSVVAAIMALVGSG